jgi:hypothetical protein
VGWLALVLAAIGGLAVVLPSPGLYIGSGLAMFAGAAGVIAYRRRWEPGRRRLAGAAGAVLAGFALAIGSARFTMVIAALRRLEALFL